MAMGRRKDRARTPGLWIATNELPVTGGHPFYHRLNQVLDTHGFDPFVEGQCEAFYATTIGRPSLTPGTYFRLLLIGYFEGIDSERGIAWRTADSLALRGFLGLGLDEAPPEHSTISRTRRLIDVETHRAVFTWILQVLATADLIKGTTIGIDTPTVWPFPDRRGRDGGVGAWLLSLAPVGERRCPGLVEGPWRTIAP